jgi:hypothetical protein
MSARESPTLVPSTSCESSPKYNIDEEDSQLTYLECENQHYYEKYYEKTGYWLLKMGWNLTHLDEKSDVEGSAMDIKPEQGIMVVSHSYVLPLTRLTIILQETSHNNCGTHSHRAHK